MAFRSGKSGTYKSIRSSSSLSSLRPIGVFDPEEPERSASRRRRQRMPRWYEPSVEDTSQHPPVPDLDERLEEYGKTQELKPLRQDILGSLPRREVELPPHSLSPMMREEEESFEASALRTLSRLMVWAWGILYFLWGVLWDKLKGRDSTARRARRLLVTIQRIGGTFIKIGQQVAMRVDLLPYAYCVELSKLLDRMPVMPLRHAIAAIQQSTGKKFAQIFSRFDPEPIGSASIACVYQAVLITGEKVAVKVRRPGIGNAFAADMRALGWIVGMVEWLAIIRPGNLRNIVVELETTLMEELNLRLEAYRQENFRRNTQNRKLTSHFYFSAPRVFFEYTNQEVIVQDFVSGMWLGELLAAVEQGNPQALLRMQELNIDPKIVAARMYWLANWGNLFNGMFHADPHPANVIVQADNHIILIDFGSCGYISSEKRNRLFEFARCRQRKDISGMVKAAITLLEPLPRVDLDAMAKDLERLYFKGATPIWSKEARWWERTSAPIWLSLMQVTRKYNLPVNQDTIKGLRATLLYDTLAARLDNEIDHKRLFRKLVRDQMQLYGKRVRARLKKRMRHGLSLEDYAKVEDLSRLGSKVIEQVRRLVENPPFNFSYSIGKPIYAALTVLRVSAFLVLMLLAATTLGASVQLIRGSAVSIVAMLQQVLSSRYFLILAALATLVALRRIMFRFNDRDV